VSMKHVLKAGVVGSKEVFLILKNVLGAMDLCPCAKDGSVWRVSWERDTDSSFCFELRLKLRISGGLLR
jgi:hypothetical protein